MDYTIATGVTAIGSGDAAPASGTPGEFTNGNPSTATPATVLPAYQMNALVEEIRNAIVAGGLTPDKANNAQLSAAIAALAAASTSAGSVSTFAMVTPPSGWLECNGAALSRTTYAALFAKLSTTWGAGDGSTTFNIPDLRGEFLRGYDDGRGIDSGRAFASTQADAYASHNHAVTDPGHIHTSQQYMTLNVGSVAESFNNVAGGGYAGQSSGVNSATTGISIAASGSTETRPKNVAVLFCIKY